MRGSWDVEAAMHSEWSVVSSFPLFLPVRTLIVGEERRSRERVRSLLERADETEVVGEFESVVEAFESIPAEGLDLVLLDVNPPELTGLAMLETLGERCPQVIFLTPPHAEDLHRAIALHGLDYLRKPFADERFYDVLRRACRRVLQKRLGQAATTHERTSALVADSHGVTASHPEELVVPEKGSRVFHVIRLHEIDWIEARDRGVRIHVGKEAFWLRRTLADVERRLDPDVFLRIHRSRIVNRTRIRAVKRLWKGEYSVILANGRSVGVGRSYQSVVETFLGNAGASGVTSQGSAAVAARHSLIPPPGSLPSVAIE